MNIKASNFVKRQTRTSEYSYCVESWEFVENLAEEMFKKGNTSNGYRDGVLLINIPCYYNRFFRTSLVKNSSVESWEEVLEARREGEIPVRKKRAFGTKQIPMKVVVVVYKRELLLEDELNENELTGAEWEIVSINASPCDEDVPMPPMTMARNQLAGTEDGAGGTKANYSGEEYAKSIMFWNKHMLISEK